MQLHEAVMVFMGLLVVGPMWLFVQTFVQSVRSGSWDLRTFAVPGVVIGLIAMVGFAFAYESRRALQELTTLLNAESASPRF